MAKYEVTTDKGVYEVETEDQSSIPSKEKPSFRSEVVGPITHAASALAFDIPRTAMNVQVNRGEPGAIQSKEFLYPEQQTVPGKMLRAGLEVPATVLGGAGRLAGKVFTKMGGVASKGLLGKVAQGVATGVTAGAATAKPTGKEYVEGIEQGALVGGAIPIAGKGISLLGKSRKTPTQIYRDILRPTQSEIQNLEIKSNKNIDDYYKLAADENLIIKQSPDKKINTEDAIAKLQDRKLELNEQLNAALASDQTPRFKLDEIGKKTKLELRKTFKNDTEYKRAVADVDEYIADAKAARGELISGEDLNNFKQGMWSVSYDPLKPNSNKTAQTIGRIAKDMIEDGYQDQVIRETNQRLGDYLTLETLLKQAHGKVIKGGRLGGYVASTIGAIAGKDIPVVGPILGAKAGRIVSDFAYNPERITKGLKPKSGLLTGKRILGEAKNRVSKFYSRPLFK